LERWMGTGMVLVTLSESIMPRPASETYMALRTKSQTG